MINILYTNRRWETFSIGILGTSFHSYFCCIIAILLWVICWVILEGFVFLFLRLYYVLSVFSIFMYVIYISRKIHLDNSFKKIFHFICLFIFVHTMWHVGSQSFTRDWTYILALEAWSFNHWMAREVRI